jgi:predicted amidophosphoribosyltransferase
MCCGLPLRQVATVTTASRCPACRRAPPAFATARAAALYQPATPPPPLVSAIHALKYRGARPVAPALARLLLERLPVPRDAVLVPVPLHPSRLRARGYNQAVMLARELARHSGRPLAVRLLSRRRPGLPQAALGRGARLRNLIDALAVTAPAGSGCVCC